MTDNLKTEENFTYAEAGEGPTIVFLHGLMGTLSNFEDTFNYFSWYFTNNIQLQICLGMDLWRCLCVERIL